MKIMRNAANLNHEKCSKCIRLPFFLKENSEL